MAVKTATVNASLVAATLTDYPAYIDLSRLGITTLAEAQSVRIYTDAGLTNEIAREIVSATECHAKVPSMTTTTQLWVDYDGVRADHAVTDTYGRNAVWGDYEYVYHMGNTSDSTGTTNLTAKGGITAGDILGKINNATEFDFSNDYFTGGGADPTTALTAQAWVKYDNVVNGQQQIINKWNTGQRAFMLQKNESADTTDRRKLRSFISSNGSFQASNVVMSTTALTLGQFYKADIVYDGANTSLKMFIDGVNENTNASVPSSIFNSSENWFYGGYPGGLLLHDGVIDEIRIRFSVLSNNWITTEHNNQNDESLFWGTWSDVGGGAVARAAARRLIFFGI